MALAVNIRTDNGTSERIVSLWEQCRVLESRPGMAALGYPPHITLAVYDDLSEELLVTAFDRLAGDSARYSLRFESLGFFEGPDKLVLWAAPDNTGAIGALHASLHTLLDPALCRLNYRPGRWVPHCSLATGIDRSRRDEVIALASRPIEPVEVIFDVVDCVAFMPVRVLCERKLPVAP